MRKRTPLWLAASQDDKVDFVKMLLEYGSRYNTTDGPEEITALQVSETSQSQSTPTNRPLALRQTSHHPLRTKLSSGISQGINVPFHAFLCPVRTQAAIMHAEKDRYAYIDLLLEHGASVQAQRPSAPSAVQSVILKGRSAGPAITDDDLMLINKFIE